MGTTSNLSARIGLFPQLTFHYGLSFEELLHMPSWAVELYISELPRILAEQHQAAIEASSFPNFERQTQRSIQRRLERMIGGPGKHESAPKLDVIGVGDGAPNPLSGMVKVEVVD